MDAESLLAFVRYHAWANDKVLTTTAGLTAYTENGALTPVDGGLTVSFASRPYRECRVAARGSRERSTPLQSRPCASRWLPILTLVSVRQAVEFIVSWRDHRPDRAGI